MEGNRRSEGWSNNGRNDGIEVREKKSYYFLNALYQRAKMIDFFISNIPDSDL